MLVWHLPPMSFEHRVRGQQGIQNRDDGNRHDDICHDMGRQLMGVAMDFDLTAALFCHLATFAMHLPATIHVHLTHFGSRGAGESGHHHDKHDCNGHETGDAPHAVSIAPLPATVAAISISRGHLAARLTVPRAVRFHQKQRYSAKSANRIGPRQSKHRVDRDSK